MKDKELLLRQYSLLIAEYIKYKKYMENKIENLLIVNNIKYQNLTSRIKEIESLSNKLNNQDIMSKLEGDIKNLNDLCGIRIVLYDNNNLNKMIGVIRDNFEICDYKNKKIDYNANNIIVKTNDDIFKNLKCEIQLVTVMSHNLIEIGHDIVYKNSQKLEKKDKVEYESIVDEYKECLEEVYKLETRIENIKMRAQNISDKYNLYEIVLSKEYVKKIETNKSLSNFYKICNDIVSLVPFLSRNADKAEKFWNEKIIVKLTNSIIKLDDDGIYTKEFVFDNYIKLLSPYSNVWIYDLNDVFKVLIPYLSSQNNQRMDKSFYEMIKNIITYDIKERKWIIFSKIKEWITDNVDYPIYRIKIVNCIINSNISYTEDIDVLKLNIITKSIDYTDEGKKMIIDLFNYCCNLFFDNQNKEIYEELVNFVYKFPFLSDIVLDFFNTNYDNINNIYKFDIVSKLYYSYKEIIHNNEFYERITKEIIYDIYKFLVYDRFDEEYERKDWKKIQIKGQKVINNYLKNINKKKYEEVSRLVDCYNSLVKDNNYNLFKFEKFLCMIGEKYKYANKLYRTSNNPYIYLGMIKANRKTKKRYDIEVLRALKHIFIKSIFLDMLNNRKNNKEKDLIFCDIITNDNNELYRIKNVKKQLFEIISHYNTQKKFIIKSYLSEDFINDISSNECASILENYKYSIDDNFFEFDINIMNIFNVYPQNVRKLIVNLIKSKKRFNNKYSLKMYISSCKNYATERKNNILLILELLKKYEYFEIYCYVDDLVEKHDKNIVNDLIDIIQSDNSEELLLAMSKFLCEVDLGLSAWSIDRLVLSNTTSDIVKKNIFNSLIDVGMVSSFSETYYKRIEELRKIKRKEKDEELRKYLDELIKYYKSNIEVEKLRELNHKNELEINYKANKK